MINLVLLEGCQKCKKLEEEIKKRGLSYMKTYCEDDSGLCDYLESLVDSYQYPMVLNVNSNNDIRQLFYVTDKYIFYETEDYYFYFW